MSRPTTSGSPPVLSISLSDQSFSGRRLLGTHQARVLVRTPLVQAEQDRPIRVEDLPKILMCGRRLRLAEQRLVPAVAGGHIAYAKDGPSALHGITG
ncbi:MAG TPA: hypothetical protein VLE48_12375 [Terriglobales bacterium]|nr:hypothetical protein [Terriglobales bacterium]